MRMKKNTRDYGKVTPSDELPSSRAGGTDAEMYDGDPMGPWKAKRDPYSQQEEVSPSDSSDDNRRWPDSLPSRQKKESEQDDV